MRSGRRGRGCVKWGETKVARRLAHPQSRPEPVPGAQGGGLAGLLGTHRAGAELGEGRPLGGAGWALSLRQAGARAQTLSMGGGRAGLLSSTHARQARPAPAGASGGRGTGGREGCVSASPTVRFGCRRLRHRRGWSPRRPTVAKGKF